MHETGMTTVLPSNKVIKGPNCNKAIMGPNGEGDLDLETILVASGGPTYAAISVRSYPPAGSMR